MPASKISSACISRPFRCAQPLHGHANSFDAHKLSLTRWATLRTYTSSQSTPSSLLTSALDQKQRTSYSSKEDSVGPFQLGISQAALRRGEKARKWSELSVGGKVIRTTQRTTNLTVILLGAGLSAVLVYALTTELFSKNSPTVLYNGACDRIKSSPKVAKYLHTPLTFHNNPPFSVRPRHRHRHIASQIAVDSSGREHMLLNFYVQGSSSASLPVKDEKDCQEASYIDILTTLTFEDIKEKMIPFIESARSAFKYLRGDNVSPVIHPAATDKEKDKDQERTEQHSWWELTGLFAGLRGRTSHDEGSRVGGTIWTEGEIHADLVRVREAISECWRNQGVEHMG
ncbi:TIM21-domain-containing protein [Chiua virens]|nr:TIM21-domain-containing protein [Chiua virens]